MFCPNCGAEVSDKAVVCVKCGVALTPQSRTTGQVEPKTWLLESILVTLFCCLPFGIAGIVNAANVSSKFNAGDLEGAQRASQQAARWTKISFWIGIACIVAYIVFLVAVGGFAAMMALADY
jgi:hypothetical protein